ncbi:hypothetical protein CJ010_17300 [Azoarcus sp. DD4]|uniref:sensor histidine kinase n=1 Tax=Azoarcus sp. DD4 TaxID=2027405 RepID=UPI00112ACB0B|nr:PAS domain S-box protein [Azoarcus sp. DD4]QDF98172.1 hypothetical protein CJ010_17300 [Azoarcus sp. DD4]
MRKHRDHGIPAAVPSSSRSADDADALADLQRQLDQCRAQLAERDEALRLALSACAESEERFRAMADAAPLMLWMTEADGQCAFINKAWQQFTGRTLDEERDDGWTVSVHPDDLARCTSAHDRAFAAREPFWVEYRLRRRDGVYRWLLDTAGPRYDSRGAFLGYIGYCVDITARRQAEDALTQRERYQRALLDNFPFLVWLKDTRGCFLAVNATLAQAFGYTDTDALVGKTDFDITATALAEGYRAGDIEVLTSRRQLNIEEHIVYQGVQRWFETYKAPVFDEHGGLLGTVGFSRDITHRKDAEAALLRLKNTLEEQVAARTAEAEARARALAESERFSRTIVDALPSALCVLDGSGRIVAVNQRWRDFAATNGGHPPDMGEGASYLAICEAATQISAADAAEVGNAIRAILAGERQRFGLEYEIHSPVRQRWFAVSISLFPGDGQIRLLVKHDDITERKLLLEEQRDNAARLKRLAAHLESVREEQNTKIAREVHDELGGTLTMLKLGLATTADAPSTPPVLQQHFRNMLGQVDSALQTVKRISASLRPAMLDTLGLIATIDWYTRQFSSMTGIDVDLQMPEYVRLSAAANTAVFRIIQEGLTNVAKHANATRVSLTLRKQRDELVVRLIDDGSGLSEGSLRKHDSYGIIGMHERAQHLGGRLRLNTAPDAGTQLILRIPLDSDAPPSTGGSATW